MLPLGSALPPPFEKTAALFRRFLSAALFAGHILSHVLISPGTMGNNGCPFGIEIFLPLIPGRPGKADEGSTIASERVIVLRSKRQVWPNGALYASSRDAFKSLLRLDHAGHESPKIALQR